MNLSCLGPILFPCSCCFLHSPAPQQLLWGVAASARSWFGEPSLTFGGQKSLMAVTFLVCWCGRRYFHSTWSYLRNEHVCLVLSHVQLCDPMNWSPPSSSVHGIFQASALEWVAISFSNAWKWKVKVKSLSRVRLLVTPWTAAYQAPPPMGFSRQEYWSGVPLPSPRHGSRNSNIWGKSILSRGNSKFKGPESGECWEFSRNERP